MSWARPSVNRVPSVGDPGRCLPVSSPPASGLYGITATCSSRAQREQLALVLAEQQVVARLHALEAAHAEHLAAADRRVPTGRRACSSSRCTAPCPSAPGRPSRAKRLVDRGRPVVEVDLVEVDVVGLQPAQRGVDRPHHVLATVALVPLVRTAAPEALGGEDDVVAATAVALHPLADQFLGATDQLDRATERVDVGGVEERDAGFEGGVHDRERRLVVALEPERHRAEAQRRDPKSGAPERHVSHLPHRTRALRAESLNGCGGASGTGGTDGPRQDVARGDRLGADLGDHVRGVRLCRGAGEPPPAAGCGGADGGGGDAAGVSDRRAVHRIVVAEHGGRLVGADRRRRRRAPVCSGCTSPSLAAT